MSTSGMPPADRVAALRQQFDESFTHAPGAVNEKLEPLLDVRCGEARYAIRVTEITALVADARITPIAAPLPELLGLAGLRGVLVPVYDLSGVLGRIADANLRWLALAGTAAPVALAFAGLERHLRVRADAFVEQGGGGVSRPHCRQVVTLPGGRLPVISIASVLEDIASRVRRCRDQREQ